MQELTPPRRPGANRLVRGSDGRLVPSGRGPAGGAGAPPSGTGGGGYDGPSYGYDNVKSGYDGPADQRAPVTNDGERPRQYDGPRQYDKKKPDDTPR